MKLYSLKVSKILLMGSVLSRFHLNNFANARGFSNIFQRVSKNLNNPIQLIYNQLESIEKSSYTKIVNVPFESINIKNCLDLMTSVTLEDIGYNNVDLRSIKYAHCVTIYSCELFDIAGLSVYNIIKNVVTNNISISTLI